MTNPLRPPVPAPQPGVLLIDDNLALHQAAQAMLGAAGIGCLAVADTLAALCVLAEQRLQAVLIDADSGPLQPWQLVRLLQQHPQQVPARLVYLSTRDDVIERARAQAAGIDCFLAKPFTAEELLAALGLPLANAA